MLMSAHSVLVSAIQCLAVVQVWLLPLLLATTGFSGVKPFYIISAVLQCLPVLFNLVVMSHYWQRGLLMLGLISNGVGGAGAVATTVIVWAMPKQPPTQPNDFATVDQGASIMLLVCAITTTSAVLQMFLACKENKPDTSYSCCWGNSGAYFSELNAPTRAPRNIVHLIRTIRVVALLMIPVSLGNIRDWAFYIDDLSMYVLNFRNRVIIALFTFVLTLLWSFIAFIISFNVNSSRKLRFAAFNALIVIIVSIIIIILGIIYDRRTNKPYVPWATPWLLILHCVLNTIWTSCAFSLAYSKYQFQVKGCCWPDCISENQLREDFELNEEL